jgi:hypothetical protein
MRRRVTVAAAAVMCAASATVSLAPAVAGAQGKTYLLTNLHADGKRMLLYSANYQNPEQTELLAACTEVKEGSKSKSKMEFTVVSSGKKYTYEYNKASTPEGLDANVGKYFGASCDKPGGLSSVDEQGIKEGRAMVGMSKKAVVMAIGYPPTSQTKSTDDNSWRYWHNRFTTMLITFDGGKVTNIKG